MKILSLNVAHGGGKRLPLIFRWLAAQAADFIFLAEWHDSSGKELLSALEAEGYLPWSYGRSAAANGVLVAGKQSCSVTRLTPESVPRGEIVAADLRSGIRIVCCHFPQRNAKRPFFDVCLSEAANATKPLLVLGDFNTGRNDLDRDPGGAKFACEDQFCTLESELVNLWRRGGSSDSGEWSWRSSKNGFRIDHAFCNEALITHAKAVSCYYDHSTREHRITDHSALIVLI